MNFIYLIVAKATVLWTLVGMTTGLKLRLEIGRHTLNCITHTHTQEPTLPRLGGLGGGSSLSPLFADTAML